MSFFRNFVEIHIFAINDFLGIDTDHDDRNQDDSQPDTPPTSSASVSDFGSHHDQGLKRKSEQASIETCENAPSTKKFRTTPDVLYINLVRPPPDSFG